MVVCDSINECEGWKVSKGAEVIPFIRHAFAPEYKYPAPQFTFCPWCGKELDWKKWERLKDVNPK